MQRNPSNVTDEQQPALDALKSAIEQCRNILATATPRLWQIMTQVSPDHSEHLKQLYDRKVTIGQYNTYRQEVSDKFKSAVADASK
jgi:hypothetical protein